MKVNYKVLFAKCADACLTMGELMKKADVSKSTVVRIKAGKGVQAKTAGKLAKALNVDVEQIII